MFLANIVRFLLIVCLVSSIIFSPCSLCANPDKDYEKHGKIVKPAYKPAFANESSLKGRQIFEQHNCSSCHLTENKGGCLGPALDGIGAYRSKRFILARITNNRKAIDQFERMYGKAELMQHPRITAPDAEFIVQYLLTLSAPKGGFYVPSHNIAVKPQISHPTVKSITALPSNILAMAGKKLFYERGCTACHSINNIGGHFAPPLDHIGKSHTSEYVSQRMTNAEGFLQNYPDEYQERGMVMPPSNLTEKEIAEITSFLMSVR
jgi:cytochrome c551/c552